MQNQDLSEDVPSTEQNLSMHEGIKLKQIRQIKERAEEIWLKTHLVECQHQKTATALHKTKGHNACDIRKGNPGYPSIKMISTCITLST